ncbi:MAG: type II toxin-antitoxin system ParD family antitoxin [Gammaproteobacteria bacterium]|nr:MAG: type II toxin-antitoxin system ParD family antitoxin [Gammaproteobacteria bacterium]
MATMNISLPDAMREWVEQQIHSGEYSNASDYLRDLIRHDQRNREQLRLALIEGEQSGKSQRNVEDILAEEKIAKQNG